MLRTELETPVYSCSVRDAAPFLSCAAVLSEGGDMLTVFAISKNPGEVMSLTVSGFSGTPVQHVVLRAPAFDICNTADAQPVVPQELPFLPGDVPEFPPASWNMLRFRLN